MRLVLFTRYPRAGEAKTRLMPLVGGEGAAAVHRVLTERSVKILLEVSDMHDDAIVEIHYTGAKLEEFSDWLGKTVKYVPQAGGDLTQRLSRASSPAPVIFFGSDTPDLSVEIVNEAIDGLKSGDAVVGPAEDGGYYLLGMNAEHNLFTGISWSSTQVFDETIGKLDAAALSYHILPRLSDCDRPEDLLRWPLLMQKARMARPEA